MRNMVLKREEIKLTKGGIKEVQCSMKINGIVLPQRLTLLNNSQIRIGI